jgi:hypothetical protein
MFNDEEARWAVCVHEAAHAVVASLGDKYVYEIAVAPVGSGEWDRDYDEYDKKRCFAHRAGYCNTPDVDVDSEFLWWDRYQCIYQVKRHKFQKHVRDHIPQWSQAHYLRELRAQVCMLLAGPISDVILLYPDTPGKVPIEPLNFRSPNDDFVKAMGIAKLMSGEMEFWRLMGLTESKLREDTVWQSVLTLARLLSEKGVLSKYEIPLPNPLGPDWPPPRPRRKRAV